MSVPHGLIRLSATTAILAAMWAAPAVAQAPVATPVSAPAIGVASAVNPQAAGQPPGWSRFDAARVMLVRGEVLRRSRSRRDADEVLGRAHAIFRDLGAAVWADRVTAEQTRLGLTRSSALVLTPTEARVARLAGDGLSTRDVAAEMGISPRTVETHLASLYGKLGVTSRAELGRVMALGETNEPPPGFHG